MIVFEIIFFALLSLYLFVRLWSVLGDQKGFDAKSKKENQQDAAPGDLVDYTPQNAHDDDADEYSNVVPLRKRHVSSVVPHDAPFMDVLKAIQKKDPTFTPQSFAKKGVSAFQAVTQAFVEGDHDTLKLLLTPTTYAHFKTALDARSDDGHRLAHDIVGEVRCVMDDATFENNVASITLKFTSHQRLTTYNAGGAVIDNPEDIAVKMVNYWTFDRNLSKKERVWKLAQTRVDDAV